MLKISDLRGKVIKGDVGIEVEVEGLEPLTMEPPNGWRAIKEDSLRHHGMEYITSSALPIASVKTKLQQLFNKLHTFKLNVGSPRTSLHVHYNVSDKALLQVLNRITAFWMFDNVLAKLCGESREGNVFCLRLKDAEGVIDYISSSLDANPPFMNMHDSVKYASLNVWAVREYGSLEVRLKGECLSANEATEWITELHTFFENADKFSCPEAIMDYYLAHGAYSFLYKMFSNSFANKINASIPKWGELVAENALLVCDLAYSRSWPQWLENVEKKRTEKKTRRDKPYNPHLPADAVPGYITATSISSGLAGQPFSIEDSSTW